MATQTKPDNASWCWCLTKGGDNVPLQWFTSDNEWSNTDCVTYAAEDIVAWEYIQPPQWVLKLPLPVLLSTAGTMRPEDVAAIKEEWDRMHGITPDDKPEIIDEPPSLSPVEVIQKLFNLFDEPPEGLTMNQINGAWEWVKYAKHVMETQTDLSNIRTEALKIELAKREPQPDDPEQAAAFCSFCDNKGHTRDRCPHLASAPKGAAPLLSEIENCQHIRVVGRSGQVTCKHCGTNLSTTPQPNRFGF